MDLLALIQAIQQVPVIGPFVVYLPPLVMFGAALSTMLPPPSTAAGPFYKALYAVANWCALNKGHATNVEAPSVAKPKPPPLSALAALLAVALAAGMLTACTTPQTARQGIYQAASAYDAALKTATAYARLPRCGQPISPPVCSDQALVTKAADAAQVALPAVNAALDTAANTKATDAAITQALAAATNAVSAFTAITVKLNLNPGA